MKMERLSAKARFLTVGSILVVLQAIDGMVTTASLNTGFLREGNIVVAGFATADWFWVVKLLITAGAIAFLYVRIKGDEAKYIRTTKILSVISLIYVGIVLWNTYWLYVVVNGVMV